MNQLTTKAIVLSRTDFGEADRILTLLTPDYGKLRVMARGVRKVKSKLAGGIELFSISDVVFIKGRGEIGTLVSTRLEKYFDQIVKNLDRTMLGYELIKQLNKVTEDEPEPEYFELLGNIFQALDDITVNPELIRLWFYAQLLKLGGHAPNLQTDDQDQKLQADQQYNFNADAMSFTPADGGRFNANHIKFLRLCFGAKSPTLLKQVQGIDKIQLAVAPLVTTMLHNHLRI
jgi:DNA repair protein RecO